VFHLNSKTENGYNYHELLLADNALTYYCSFTWLVSTSGVTRLDPANSTVTTVRST